MKLQINKVEVNKYEVLVNGEFRGHTFKRCDSHVFSDKIFGGEVFSRNLTGLKSMLNKFYSTRIK